MDMIETASSGTTEGYLRYTRRKVLFIAAMAAVLAGMGIFTIRLGASGLSYGEIVTYLLHPDNSWNSTVVWDIRLPRVVASILAGAALGIAGTVMQGILRNPLASPFTLGISNAAAFGAAVGILVLQGTIVTSIVSVNDPLAVTAFAFAFAMVATGVMLLLVRITDSTPETIILAGLAISSIFSAALAFLQYMANDVELAAIVYWQFGSLSKVTWGNIHVMAGALALAFAYFFVKRWDYNAMEAGEDVARGLGVKIERTRALGLTVSAVLTATVVSFLGIIGFIGLIGPHMVKRVIGNDSRFTLTGSMAVGAAVLMLAYVIGSYAFRVVIPVGIITSAIGGPLFIAILMKGRLRRRC